MSGFHPDESDSLIGRILGGKYELLSRIGSGSMGAVYRARHLTLRKDVAVKVLHSDTELTDKAMARFEAEARAASRFDHTHSVNVLDFGQDETDGLLYIVMEHLNGRDLRQLVLQDGPLDERRACRIMAQVTAALGAAHDQGIIHRDMKPGNIMVTTRIGDQGEEEEFVKICDFGIAKLMPRSDESHSGEPLTLKGSFFGTPAYMSPEQAQGGSSDGRSDIYSCGLILWMLLAGQRPYQGDTAMVVALKQINDPLPALEDYRPGVSQGVLEIIRKATHKNPNSRFESARHMHQILQAYSSESKGDVQAAAMVEKLLSSDGLRTAVDEESLSINRVIPPALVAAICLVLGLVFATYVITAVSDQDAPTSAQKPAINLAASADGQQAAVEFMGPPIPEKIYVTLTGVSEGTEVYSLGQLIGVAPGQIEMVKDTQAAILILKKEGFVTTSTRIIPERDQSIVIKMKPNRPKPSIKKSIRRPLRRRDRLENPFE